MINYTVEISVDNADAEEFCKYLNDNGHCANIGGSTGNYIDSDWTSNSPAANAIFNELWGEYCCG